MRREELFDGKGVGMNRAVGKSGHEHQFWPIVGPLLAFCMLLVILFRAGSVPLGLPLMTLAGIVLCHLWKWRGVAISSLCLAAVSSYYIYQQPTSLWMWSTALSLCIVSIFVVTVLCFEEFSLRWERLCKNAQDHRQTLAHLNDQYHSDRQRFLDEQLELQQQLTTLKQDLKGKEEKVLASERLAQLAHDELVAGHAQQEKIYQELFQARQQHAILSVTLEELQERVFRQGVEPTSSLHLQALAEIDQLKVDLQNSINEIERHNEALQKAAEDELQLKLNLQLTLDDLQKHKAARESATEEIMQLKLALQQAADDLEKYKIEWNNAAEEVQHLKLALQRSVEAEERLRESSESQQSIVEELGAHIERMSHEKQQAEAVISTLKERELASQAQLIELEKNSSDEARKMQGTCAKLMDENASLALQLEQARSELCRQEQEPVESLLEISKVKEIRRLEGLYNQLRQQFAEKTEVLAITRRELFSTQEKLASLQKEVEESRICGSGEVDISLQKLLQEAESELESAEAEHAAEIARLHEVIDSLMACEKRA